MASFFCLSIRFLDPAFHGRKDGGEPEWPPSPLRAFQALVSAAAYRWRKSQFDTNVRPALEWLERLTYPLIIAPIGRIARSAYRTYVPNNVADLVAAAWSRGNTDASIADYKVEKDFRPTQMCDGETVHYLFPLADAFCPFLKVLSDSARSITHLGWGVDMVAGNASVISDEEVTKLHGVRWQPTAGPSADGLRVPIRGTLNELTIKYLAFLNRLTEEGFTPVTPLSAFRTIGYRRTNDPPACHYAAFRLRHPVEDRSAVFAMTRANSVAAMMRNATAIVAQEQGRDKDWIDRYVHGHREKDDPVLPRFSYLSLPSIEHRGHGNLVVGAIRRVLVAELIESGPSHLLWVRQMLPGQFLIDETTRDRKALLTPLTGKDWILRQYTDPSDTWATVTPLVFPGSDDGRYAKTEKLFSKTLRHAGYSPDALAELDFRNVSFWPGGELALNFQRPNYLKNGHWSVYHVRLRWKQSIKGPLAIGAGRHCGLGIFAAMNK